MIELVGKLRKVEDVDRKNLRTVSYSKLDTLESCTRKYDSKYNKKLYAEQNAIHLDIGTLCHKILEIKGRMKIAGDDVDYEYLKSIFKDGVQEITDKGQAMIIGTEAIKQKYGFEKWFEPDNASGMNYEQKCEVFLNKVLPNAIEDKNWKCFATEMRFEFVYRYGTDNAKEVIIMGFIDRVDIYEDETNGVHFAVCDYKTSKKRFDDKKMATPLQQVIYNIGLFEKYGILPELNLYEFILINERQCGCTKGYLKRAVKKLDKLLNKIDELEAANNYPPSPTPLCHWCDYCATNPDADERYKHVCDYYSLWTPENKTFEVHRKWGEVDGWDKPVKKNSKTERKLIF